MPELGTGVSIAIALFLLVLAVLWFILPFIVFSMNSKLERLVQLQTAQLEAARVSQDRLVKLTSEVEDTLSGGEIRAVR